mmetsp:Transcript_48326/g.126368  ORF Transcript_48326/g.126368 Transcript_48326/m.126368 type:complete len:272 (-) Transcript_48326:642-1457(-)
MGTRRGHSPAASSSGPEACVASAHGSHDVAPTISRGGRSAPVGEGGEEGAPAVAPCDSPGPSSMGASSIWPTGVSDAVSERMALGATAEWGEAGVVDARRAPGLSCGRKARVRPASLGGLPSGLPWGLLSGLPWGVPSGVPSSGLLWTRNGLPPRRPVGDVEVGRLPETGQRVPSASAWGEVGRTVGERSRGEAGCEGSGETGGGTRWTRRLAPWRSVLKRRMSRHATRCTSSTLKRLGEKSSALPSCGTNRCTEPTLVLRERKGQWTASS